MRERINPVLRILCIALAGLFVVQLSRVVFRKNPLSNLILPTLAVNPVPAQSQLQGANSLTSSISTNTPKTTGASSNAIPTNGANSKSVPAGLAPSGLPPGVKPGGPPMMGGGPPGGGIELSPAMQAKIEKVVQSEVLGQIMRPMPMGLLGIAGRDVFFRAPNGQTGMIREGEELGGVKLLKVGTNRILVEHENQKKELTLFSGFGSEALLPKGKENPQ